MQTYQWIALGRSVFDAHGPMREGFYLPPARIAQVGKNAPPYAAELIALAPTMLRALQSAARGDSGPARAIVEAWESPRPKAESLSHDPLTLNR